MRNSTRAGRLRRQAFEDSLDRLETFGFSEWAVEYYRKTAQQTGVLPHKIICIIVEGAAWRSFARDKLMEPKEPA